MIEELILCLTASTTELRYADDGRGTESMSVIFFHRTEIKCTDHRHKNVDNNFGAETTIMSGQLTPHT
jgi:hypothetical protein